LTIFRESQDRISNFFTFKKVTTMNGLTAVGSWENQQPLMMAVYSIIDAKIDSIELKTRKFLSKLSRKESNLTRSTESTTTMPSMTDWEINKTHAAQVFEQLETLSRSITLLENMKFSLNETNATKVLELLGDDKFLTNNDLEMQLNPDMALAA
jgi:hypothetical protein